MLYPKLFSQMYLRKSQSGINTISHHLRPNPRGNRRPFTLLSPAWSWLITKGNSDDSSPLKMEKSITFALTPYTNFSTSSGNLGFGQTYFLGWLLRFSGFHINFRISSLEFLSIQCALSIMGCGISYHNTDCCTVRAGLNNRVKSSTTTSMKWASC